METKVNPWLEKKLQQIDLNPETLSLVIEIDYQKADKVTASLRQIPNVTVGTQVFDYINIKAPVEAVSAIEQIEGVKRIHYDMPKKTLSSLPTSSDIIKLLSQIPILQPFLDPILGQVRIDPVVMPNLAPDLILPFSPLRTLSIINYKYVPTSATKQALLDVPHELTGKGVKVAVLDTGILNLHPQFRMKAKELGTKTFPAPIDDNGHGQWCCSTVAGDPWMALFGMVEGMAPQTELLSVKVLGFGIGTGSLMSVLEGIEIAYKNDAKIISMSEAPMNVKAAAETKMADPVQNVAS